MQDVYIEFGRVCSLQVGDLFLLNGRWRRVYKVDDERTCYCLQHEKNRRDSLPKNSQQIFQVVKKENVERC